MKAAGSEFRAKGIVATGLADLMKAAGLTHGGFYKHFESKDQLVAEAFDDAIQEILGRMEAAPTIAAAISGYLSAQHRDHPASGCPLSAIGSELARTDAKTRDAATAGVRAARRPPGGQIRGKGREAPRPGGGLHADRCPDDGAGREQPDAVGGDPERGGDGPEEGVSRANQHEAASATERVHCVAWGHVRGDGIRKCRRSRNQ